MQVDIYWQNRGYAQLPDGRWQAEITALVTAEPYDDAFDEGAVEAYMRDHYGIARNLPHPYAQDQPWLLCNFAGVIENPGPMAMKFRATYEIPVMGIHPDDKTNPLSARPTIKWDVQYREIPTEYDSDGRFICNSAGFPPSTDRTRRIKIWSLMVTRYEPFFNLGLADTCMNCVNDAPVTIGPYFFDTGQVYADKICPAADFQEGANYLLMSYCLEFDSHAKHPYQLYLKDTGQYGWWKDDAGHYGTGPFGTSVTVAGQTVFVPVSEPILLDGKTGVPFAWSGSPSYQIGVMQADGTFIGKPPVASPHSSEKLFQACPDIPRPASVLAPGGLTWVRPYRQIPAFDIGILQLGFDKP